MSNLNRCASVRAPVVCSALMFACMVMQHANANTERAEVGARVEAIWLVQSFEFHHISSSVVYSCDELRGKIAAILRSVGAYERLIVQIGCNGNFVRSARASITLASPVEATPENIRRATTFDARAQLIARTRNLTLPTAEGIERFPATWRRISLRGQGLSRRDSGDCELIRATMKQIFPKLSTRVRGLPLCIEGTRGGMAREVLALVRDSTVPPGSVPN